MPIWNIKTNMFDCPYRELTTAGRYKCHHIKNKTWNPRYCNKPICPIKVKL